MLRSKSIFITGGSGLIGQALTQHLITRGHRCFALSRSKTSDLLLKSLGATPIRGDLRHCENWIRHAATCQAVIHLATTFTPDMGEVDNRFVEALLTHTAAKNQKTEILYTGGCWLYGNTGDKVADETLPFSPLSSYSWMIENSQLLETAQHIDLKIIHPALVYHETGGCIAPFLEAIQSGTDIEIWGDPHTRWPLIHRKDLATAYGEVLENSSISGHFNANTEQGLRVIDIAKTLKTHFQSNSPLRVLGKKEALRLYGAVACGPMLDQQMQSTKLQTQTRWRSTYAFKTIFSQ